MLTLILLDRNSLAQAERAEDLQQGNCLACNANRFQLLHHIADNACHHFSFVQDLAAKRMTLNYLCNVQIDFKEAFLFDLTILSDQECVVGMAVTGFSHASCSVW